MIKTYDSSVANIANGPYGEDYTSGVIDRLRDKETIFDIMQEMYGIQLLNMNPSSLQPMGANGAAIPLAEDGYTTQAPLAHRYIVKEISKVGLGGEYNTLQGVKPMFKTMRYIDFICGKEETVEPIGYDPVIDTDIAGLIASAQEDWAVEIAAQRETRYYEQVTNGGVLVKDVLSLRSMHDFIGTGYTVPVEATDLLSLTDTEFGQMILALGQYPMSLNVSGTCALMVSTAMFNKIRDNQYLQGRKAIETVEMEIRSRRMMELEGAIVICEVPRKKLPAKVDMMLAIPGTAVCFESFVRPIKVRSALNARAAGYESNVIYDGDFVGGTYQQIVMLVDSFDQHTGDAQSDGINGGGTDMYIVVNLDGTFVQDPTKVLSGQVNGTAGEMPQSMEETNRTLRAVIDETSGNNNQSDENVTASAKATKKAKVKEAEVK